MEASTIAVQTNNVSFRYDNGHLISFPDLICEKGSSHLVLGKSGSGKTTLLRLLSGISTPVSGNIKVNHTDLQTLSNKEKDDFRGKTFGYVPQLPQFVKSLNLLENIQLSQHLAGLQYHKSESLDVLSQLNIAKYAHKKTFHLSQGERQRFSIAMALLKKCSILLADEPTSALDDDNTQTVLNLLLAAREQMNATLIIVTHDKRVIDAIQNKTYLD